MKKTYKLILLFSFTRFKKDHLLVMAEAANRRGALLEELLSCSLCLEFFKSPKCLPCLHRFCTKCLVNYSKAKHGIFSCPLCKKQYEKVTLSKDIHKFKDDMLFGLLAEEKENGFADTSKAIQIQNLLSCSNCNHILKEPRVLSCFTMVCEKCLRKLTFRGEQQPSTFHCVKCEKLNMFLNEENQNYKVDFLVKSLVNVIHPLIEIDDICRAHDKDVNLVCLRESCNSAISKVRNQVDESSGNTMPDKPMAATTNNGRNVNGERRLIHVHKKISRRHTCRRIAGINIQYNETENEHDMNICPVITLGVLLLLGAFLYLALYVGILYGYIYVGIIFGLSCLVIAYCLHRFVFQKRHCIPGRIRGRKFLPLAWIPR